QAHDQPGDRTAVAVQEASVTGARRRDAATGARSRRRSWNGAATDLELGHHAQGEVRYAFRRGNEAHQDVLARGERLVEHSRALAARCEEPTETHELDTFRNVFRLRVGALEHFEDGLVARELENDDLVLFLTDVRHGESNVAVSCVDGGLVV